METHRFLDSLQTLYKVMGGMKSFSVSSELMKKLRENGIVKKERETERALRIEQTRQE